MDHISRWIRHRHEQNARLKKEHSRSHPRSAPPSPALEAALSQVAAVERVISSIDSRLTAQAALQCKAYARSLLNFEKRIYELRNSNAADAKVELQGHYEHIHEIYAALDEPDGMEGVSTMVLMPSLEQQIREHESLGRWTSAQSCWEVQIQESQDDLSLHLGLLRCLRNLGHYGSYLNPLISSLAAHADRCCSFPCILQTRFEPISEALSVVVRNGRTL